MKVELNETRKLVTVASLDFGDHFVYQDGDGTVYQLTDGITHAKEHLVAVNVASGITRTPHQSRQVYKVTSEQDTLRFRYE